MKLHQCRIFLLLAGLLFLTLSSRHDACAGDSLGCQGKVELGYRAVSSDGNPDRAFEYGYLKSSPSMGLHVSSGAQQEHFILDAEYLNEKDYRAEMHLDHAGLARLDLRSERFFHNLDHIPYEASPEARPDGVTSDGLTRVTYEDFNVGKDYGIRVDTNEARFRGKLKAFPAHLNLAYWRFEKKGDRQLRFVDEGHDPAGGQNCVSCHMQSKTRDIDLVTEEFTGGADVHLGPVNLQFEQVLRQLRDRERTPVDSFGGHWLRDPGDYQHDELPDSRLAESTLRLYTSQAGGFIASLGLTVGERKNRSDLVDVRPVEVETDYYKASGDLTVIPNPQWTLNFRYRLLDMDSTNDDQLQSDSLNLTLPPAAGGITVPRSTVDVREAMDITRAYYAAAVNYRPTRHLTLKGDYAREEIHRGNTGGPDEHHSIDFAHLDTINIDPFWELPEDEAIDRYRVGFNARMFKKSALKLNGWYQYKRSDDPAYGTSAENSHQAFLSANYSPSSAWGLTGTANVLKEESDRHSVSQFKDDGSLEPYQLNRNNEQENLSVGLWSNPVERLFCSLNYGYLRSRIVQDLLFGADPSSGDTIEDENVEYSQRVHTVSLQSSYRVIDNLTCRLEGYHIRSYANYSPDFAAKVGDIDSLPVDPSGLDEISRLEIRQNGLRLGVDWKLADGWNASADYTYDDYEDRNSSVFDGTAQTYSVSLARAW